MVEDLTNCVGIIKYTLSTGEQVAVTSNMSEEEIINIQGQFWRSYGRNFHPNQKNITEIKTDPKQKVKNSHREKFHHHR
jgi:phosphoglucomutase